MIEVKYKYSNEISLVNVTICNIRCAKIAAIMDKIPDQVGYLVLTEDGAVLESGGELENDERVATIITDLITLSNKCVMVKLHCFTRLLCGFLIVDNLDQLNFILSTFVSRVDPLAFAPNELFKKITITYDDHWFVICLSNKKIYVVKRIIQQGDGNTINV